MPASVVRYPIPNGGLYDAANLVIDPEGAVWSASGTENVVAKLTPDGTSVTRWTFFRDAAPSSLLRNPDGTFFITELGGFNIAKFDPATGTLVEWPDVARRPTSFVRRADGKLLLTETAGTVTLFDPATGTFVYYRASNTFSLSYPWEDPDGTIWACDFLSPAIFHFNADFSNATRWVLPVTSGPSKVIRGPDGAIWISLYGLGQLARLDPATNQIRIYQIPFGAAPFDLARYKDRIVFTDQRNGFVGFFEPAAAAPVDTQTVVPTENIVALTTVVSAPVTTTLTSTTEPVTPSAAAAVTGFKNSGFTQYAAGAGVLYAMTIDEKRGRIYLGAQGALIGTLLPPIGAATDQFLPSAASIAGRLGARWKTQLVTWNRGLAKDTAGVPLTFALVERLLPSAWIAGYSPFAAPSLAPNRILNQPDPITDEMLAPDTFGALSFAPAVAPSELFGWGRVSTTRADGGTYGFARNTIASDRAIGAGQSGFFFAPPDAAGQRTNAGLYVFEAAKGTIAAVDPDGVTRASVSFDWPGGYHMQGSTIFQALGIDPIASARIVFTVASGKVLPFGISIDNITNDPIGLEVFADTSAAANNWLPGVARGAGPLGPSARTDLQLYNPGSAAATVSLIFRAWAPAGDSTAPVAKSGSVTVPAGRVLTLSDVLGTLGVSGAAGTLDVAGNVPVFAFARVTASPSGGDPYGSGGSYGFGLAARQGGDAVVGGSRAVFISVTDNGFNAFGSDLVLTNISDTATSVTLNLTNLEGTSAGTRTVALPARATRFVPTVWYDIAGYGADAGRVDVVPPDGSSPVLATVLRQDRKTGDLDALLPFLMPR